MRNNPSWETEVASDKLKAKEEAPLSDFTGMKTPTGLISSRLQREGCHWLMVCRDPCALTCTLETSSGPSRRLEVKEAGPWRIRASVAKAFQRQNKVDEVNN